MNVAIISDTHVPGRVTEIPAWVREQVCAADHAIHAGDFDSAETLADVRDMADGALTAVSGNIDPPLDLPEVATVELEGVTFVVVHGTGDRLSYEERVASIVREAASDADPLVGVAGHIHEPVDQVVDGVRLLNPGTATGANEGDETSMMTARVVDGDVDVELHTE